MARRADVLEPPVREELPLFGDGRARRLRRRRKIFASTAVVLAMLLLAGGAFVASQRNAATPVGLEAAMERFRADGPTEPDVEAAPQIESAPTGSSAESPSTVAEDGPATAKEDKAPAVARSVSSPKPYELPAEGVYSYRTRGGESISMFGAKHDYPEETFATVRHLEGCRWEHRNEVIEEHVDTRHFCGTEGSLTQLLQGRMVTFFGQTDGATMRCDPAMVVHKVGEPAGRVTQSRCTDGDGGDATMVRTFEGTDDVTVGGSDVKAVKVRVDGTMTGKVEGTSSDTIWFHPTTGMTLRWDRTVDTMASAYGAKVRYREDASFVLDSLEPRR